MLYPIYCPDCHSTFYVEASKDAGPGFRSFACDTCLEDRRKRLNTIYAVGGMSLTDEAEAKMTFPIGVTTGHGEGPGCSVRSPMDSSCGGGRRVTRNEKSIQ